MLNRPFTLPMVLANLTMVQQFLGFPNIIGVYWTLQIELIFYAISAGLFVIGWLGKARMVAATTLLFLGAALLAAALRYWTEEPAGSDPSGPDGDVLGAPVALHARAARECPSTVHYGPAAIVVVLPPLCVLAYNFDTGFGETWYRYLISYYAAMALFVLFTARIRLTHPVLIYLGPSVTRSISSALSVRNWQHPAGLRGRKNSDPPLHPAGHGILDHHGGTDLSLRRSTPIALGRRLSDRGIADRRQTAGLANRAIGGTTHHGAGTVHAVL